ncbi:phytoene desaturase family protein, partial [Oceaniglobus roseus]|uniref:phytoene desaturase family protein n=1 Tax=Oceaniglobus roseus TaxID=1737570 RepID=UPI0013000DD3
MTHSDSLVVIGAGLGGLSAALRLAHGGFDVTLLDSHAHVGGKMRTLPSAAGPVDAGPTVLTLRPVLDRLFADVGERLEDHVTLDPEPLLARHFWRDGSRLDLFADPGDSAAAIAAFAGAKAARQYRAFAADMARLFDAFEAPMMLAPAPNRRALTAHVLRHPSLVPLMAPHRTMAG